MSQEAPARTKIPTKSPQPARGGAAPAAGRGKAGRAAPGRMLAGGTGRAATRGGGPVIELECGITVHPAREEQGRWRAGWRENGERRQCEAASEEKLAAKLAKVTERLEADAPNMTLRGADLIAFYLSADRLPVQRQWSRKHAHTQRRLCERFAAPVIDAIVCQDIKTEHMQKIVNAAPMPGGGRPGPGHDLGPGHRGPGGRVPGQLAAGEGALAGRGPPDAPAACECRGRVGAVG